MDWSNALTTLVQAAPFGGFTILYLIVMTRHFNKQLKEIHDTYDNLQKENNKMYIDFMSESKEMYNKCIEEIKKAYNKKVSK